ncbi:hypothetical protein PROFUN_11148, partial [Planoprotostelium fungivorum]
MIVQPLPADVWTEVFSFLPTSDLCVPCFTSKTLRDVAHKIINSRDPNHRHWWRYKKQLPTHNREIPVYEESRDAAHRDDLDVLDLLGWDNSQASPRHRNLCQPGWRREMILVEALAKGSKRTINACHQKEDISGAPSVKALWLNVWPRLGEEGNLEVIQWLHNEQSIEGLPSVTWPESISKYAYVCLVHAAKAGHKHVINWFKERGDIDERIVHEIYKGAAEGGRADVLDWLEENEIHFNVTSSDCPKLADFVQSLAVLEWALRHNVPRGYNDMTCTLALRAGCAEAVQLAIEHGYINKESHLWFKSTDEQFELICWMHERDILHPEFFHSAKAYGNLDVLQWAAEKGYLTKINAGGYRNAPSEFIEWMMKMFDIEEIEIYHEIAMQNWRNVVVDTEFGEKYVMTWEIEPIEWMLQRKWNKSQDE